MIHIDGKTMAATMLDAYAEKSKVLANNNQTLPKLAVVLVGDDPSSKVYVKMILKRCQKAGILSERIELGDKSQTQDVIKTITELNHDSDVHGIIVQFPLPAHIDANLVRETIDERKDVDSAGTRNIGKFFAGQTSFKPCTPLSMLALAKSVKSDLTALKCVVVGRSLVVGKPIADMMLAENMTVTICHSRTADLTAELKQADIIMAAVGKAGLIKASDIKQGAIIIDAGINVTANGIVGDVDPAGMEDIAMALTPVPGGVGPVTIVMLIGNVFEAYDRLQ